MERAMRPLQFALRIAHLTGQRPGDVLRMSEADISGGVLRVQQGKTKAKLRIVIDGELEVLLGQALAIQRYAVAGTWNVFGNLSGQRYTKGGWKSTLSKLMNECVAEGQRRKIGFRAFSLQDCRPRGVSKKLERATAM
jgi:integrase